MKENKAPTLFRGLRFVGFAALLAVGVVLVEAAFQAAPAKHVTKQAESLETTEEFVVAGWEVETAGAMKNIEDIRPGDVVMAMDDETGEMLPKRVVQVFKNFADHVYVVTIRSSEDISEQVIRATGVHPFFVPGRGWIEAQQLRSGDSLVQSDEQVATVVAVNREDFEQPIAVYNFEVEDFHTYFVGESHLDVPVLAHNAPCTPTIGSSRHIKNLTKANNGTYKLRFTSKKTYTGKGGTDRARRSAVERSRKHSDPVESIEHQAADNDVDAFKTEHEWLKKEGGPESNDNYNKINSPGKNM